MKVTIDIDTAEALIVPVLKRTIEQFEQDLEDYKSGNRFIAIFDTDPKKDKKEIKKHIKAFKKVAQYYSIPGEFL
jgi:hypothetical protein